MKHDQSGTSASPADEPDVVPRDEQGRYLLQPHHARQLEEFMSADHLSARIARETGV
jgi:hypothetical protein